MSKEANEPAEKLDYLSEKFSFSKANTFSLCPRKSFHRYVMREREPAGPALLFGRGVHEGVEEDNRAKLRGEELPLESIVEAGVEAFKAEASKEGIKGDVDGFAREFDRQVEVYQEAGIRRQIHPAPDSIEAAFRIEAKVGDVEHGFAPVLIEGYCDVVSVDEKTGERRLIDYKSAARPTSQKEAENHLQLAVEATGAQAEAAQIVTMVKMGKQKPTTKITAPVRNTKDRFDKAMMFLAENIHGFRRALITGDFPKCAPTSFWCNYGKSCAYGRACFPDTITDLPDFVQVQKIVPVGALPEEDWRMSAAGRRDKERREGGGSTCAAEGQV